MEAHLIRLALVFTVGFPLTHAVPPSIRLPGDAVPSRYRLDIVTNLDGDFSFQGEVWVDLKVTKATDRLTLHSSDLDLNLTASKIEILPTPLGNISNNNESSPDASKLSVVGYETEKDLSFLTVLLSHPVVPGPTYRLYLQYTGHLSENLSGYYKVGYKEEHSGNASWLAATVFEPTEARRAFPCWDEPAIKARFQLNLARPKKLITIANMPIMETKPMKNKPDWEWDHYEESPPMSTYLVAWVVGKLTSRQAEVTKSSTESTKPFHVWARPEVVNHSQYALSIGPRILKKLEEYVGMGEQLPKTDLVALPNFISDALENWGIISFEEPYLLQPPGATAPSKHRIANIVAHELAHSWFGNLVSVKWWDAIWLNEGFATYFATIAVDHVEPKFDVHAITALKAFLEVSNRDSLRTSHALTATASRGSDLYQIFNSITYFKGYYLLRMLNHTLGEDTFRTAISRYLFDHRFSSVDEDDFWSAINSQVAQDGVHLPPKTNIKTLMSAWSKQPGLPIVTVSRNYSDATAEVSQMRFLRSEGDVSLRTVNASHWWVPLTYTTAEEKAFHSTKPRVWLDPNQDTTLLHGLPGKDHWVLFNLQAAGLYRVNYDEHNWHLLSELLNSDDYETIPPLNRALLLDDVLDLARADLLPYHVVFNITNYLSREKHYLPWKAYLSNLDFIYRMLQNTNSSESFEKYILRQLSPRFEEIRMGPKADDDDLMQNLNRKQIVKWACLAGHQWCVDRTLELFREWRSTKSDTNLIPIDLRSTVYCTAITHGGEEDWNFLWHQYKNANHSSQRTGILDALGCSKDKDILTRYLQWSISPDSGVRKQNSASVFEAVAKNNIGHSLATTFIRENINKIIAYIGSNPFHLPKLLESLALVMNTPEQFEEIHQLQAEHAHRLKDASQTLNHVNEMVLFNIQWLKKNYNTIEQWLKENSENSS